MVGMATWRVLAFDDGTEELVAEHSTHGIEASEVRQLWGLPSSSAIGELQVTEDRRAFLDSHLDRPT